MKNIENYFKLSIKELNKYGYLKKGVNKGTYYWINSITKDIRLKLYFEVKVFDNSALLKITNPITNKIQCVNIVSSPCYFGGVRWYFLSPKTNKKFTDLYFNFNGLFEDRESLNLLYSKQLESKRYRKMAKILGPTQYEIDKLMDSIKYPYRNGKITRKQKKLLKITNSSLEKIELKRRAFKEFLRH